MPRGRPARVENDGDRVDLSSGWRTADVQRDRCVSRSFLPSRSPQLRLFPPESFVPAPRIASNFVVRHCTYLLNARQKRRWRSSRSRIKGIHVSKSRRLLATVRLYYPSYLIIARFHQSAVPIGQRRPLINAHARYLIYMHQFLKFLSYSSVTD